jgi:hypothetical protein
MNPARYFARNHHYCAVYDGAADGTNRAFALE